LIERDDVDDSVVDIRRLQGSGAVAIEKECDNPVSRNTDDKE